MAAVSKGRPVDTSCFRVAIYVCKVPFGVYICIYCVSKMFHFNYNIYINAHRPSGQSTSLADSESSIIVKRVHQMRRHNILVRSW